MDRPGTRLFQPCSCLYLGTILSPGNDGFSLRIHVSISSPHRVILPILLGGKTSFLLSRASFLYCHRIQCTGRNHTRDILTSPITAARLRTSTKLSAPSLRIACSSITAHSHRHPVLTVNYFAETADISDEEKTDCVRPM